MTPAPIVVAFGVLLLSALGLLVGLFWVQSQVSDLRSKLEAARLRQKDDERELLQRSALDSLKDEFVATVSHELRTPLTSIRGSLGLLSSGILGAVDLKAEKLLSIALSNTERLIRLINDILDLERMDSGRSVLDTRRCSLSDLLNQAIETMNPMADEGQVRLLITGQAQALLPGIFFDADADRILQVLTNLLSNAIKFSPVGSVVTVDVETPPDELIFRITDQGRGIPEDQLETVFERFKQVEETDARQMGGTGLGLAICRSIIQQHGGTIWAQRNLSIGACISVRLPRQQRTYDVALPVGGSTSGFDCPVLICDDNDAHRQLVVSQLRARGHCVLEAASSGQAIDIARSRAAQSPVKAILLDMHMSDMKKWELLRLLTRNAATAGVPIAVLSMGGSDNVSSRWTRNVNPAQRSDDHLINELGQALSTEDRPGRVLLVEDDLDLARVVLDGFHKTSVLVEHASTLQQAKLICRGQKPDLVILDLTLPDGSGFLLVEWFRANPDFRSLPLIVYSGREVDEHERAKLRLGPTRFLTKAKVTSQDVERLVLAMVDKRDAEEDTYPDLEAGAA